MYKITSLFFLFFLISSTHDNLIEIVYEEQNDEIIFYATNTTNYTLSLAIDIDCSGFKSSYYSFSEVLDPNAYKVKIGKIKKQNGAYHFNYKTHYVYGNFYKSKHDKKYIYRLPFENKNTIVTQGYNGAYSHEGKKALDFALPYNAKILAARDGKIFKIVDWNTKGCPDKSCQDLANYILIEHDDGTLGAYYHFSPKSIVVKEGNFVKTGDFIGKNGSTGWSSLPHLHFEVRQIRAGSYKTVNTLFNTKRGVRYLKKDDVINLNESHK